MIKGVNKSIIEINDTKNKYIEKAIFIIKPDISKEQKDELNKNMDSYVEQILFENYNYYDSKPKFKKNKIILPMCSVAVVAIITIIIYSL